MKIGGWKTRSVFERYAIVNRSDSTDAMRLLQQTEKAVEKPQSRLVTLPSGPGASAHRAHAPRC
jgi:hypothetical protein